MSKITFGAVRHQIIDDIKAVRERRVSIGEAHALAALFKELNNNAQVEINAARLLGKGVPMGDLGMTDPAQD